MDQFLLEALREVDAITPGSPPVTPPEYALVAKLVENSEIAAQANVLDWMVGHCVETSLTPEEIARAATAYVCIHCGKMAFGGPICAFCRSRFNRSFVCHWCLKPKEECSLHGCGHYGRR